MDEGTFRIGSINIDNLPLTAEDPQNEILFQAIHNYEIEITLFQEVGVNWSNVSRANQFRARADTYLDQLTPTSWKRVISIS